MQFLVIENIKAWAPIRSKGYYKHMSIYIYSPGTEKAGKKKKNNSKQFCQTKRFVKQSVGMTLYFTVFGRIVLENDLEAFCLQFLFFALSAPNLPLSLSLSLSLALSFPSILCVCVCLFFVVSLSLSQFYKSFVSSAGNEDPW